MTQIFYTLAFTLFAWTFTNAQAPEYIWTKALHGTSSENVQALYTDPKGYVYVAGSSNGTTDLDPGAGSLMVTPSASSQQIAYVCKFDPSGALMWAKWLDGSAQILSLCVDNSGNVYGTGRFQSVLDFNPATPVFTLNGGGESCFIWKLSSTGQFLGAGKFGEGTLSFVGSPLIRFDGQQNLYCSGSFKGSADIDPGVGVTTVSFTSSSGNAYLLKLDLSLNLTWSALFRSTGYSGIDDIEFDSNGNPNVELMIASNGTVDIDPGVPVQTFNCNGTSNKVIVKLNTSGNLISHIHAAAGNSWLGGYIINNLEIDNNNDVFFRTAVTGTVLLNPGTSAIPVNAGYYLLHFTQAGTFIKYDTITNGGVDFVLHDDTLVFAGAFNNTSDFDPSGATFTAASTGSSDAFVYALDKSFQLQWLRTFGGPGNDYVYAIALANSGEIYAAGGFSNTCDFDPGTPSMTITSQAFTDAFISKFSACTDIPFNTSDYTICAGSSASLMAVSASSLNWYQNSTGGTALSSGSVYSTPVLTAGTHSYYVSSTSCSLMPRTEVVIVAEPGPSIAIASPSGSICLGNSATLTATGASSFQWSGGPSTSKYVVAPTQNTVYAVAGTHTLNTCTSTKTVSVLVSGCVGLREVSTPSWEIYPNPTTGMIYVEGWRYTSIEVFDVTGKVVFKMNPESNQASIDLTNLPHGIYLLYIKNEERAQYHKLIKDR